MTVTDSLAGPVDNRESEQSVIYTLPFATTQITDGFWANYQQTNRNVSLAHGYAMLEKAGNLSNLRIAAGVSDGGFSGYLFADSDVYKWLEAMGWELGRAADKTLQHMADEVITLIEKAQQADGYLNSYFQITAPEKRWTDLDHAHELYCAGHLIQAAVAFHRAARDNRLLRVALRFVDHIDSLFGEGKREETCGHQEIEMALVELFRITRDEKHLTLAKLFIDRRGQKKMRGYAGYGPAYQQDHAPVRDATEVVGHAVRQLYLTTGVTDLYMETGEQALIQAMHTLWEDMTQYKLYVTGSIGSRFDGEAFGSPYELPSDAGYCETCAAIASLMWNWRLLLVTGQSRYADLFERTLYNGVLSSPGLEGASYLYVNPLQVRNARYVRSSADAGTGKKLMRPEWYSCACCPPNVMRLFSSLSHYLATANEEGIQIHQFATANLDVTIHNKSAKLEIKTDYPWDGKITVKIKGSPATPWRLSLRLPEWCRAYGVTLNGAEVAMTVTKNGYLTAVRAWQPGDELQLDLHLEPAFLAPHPRIDALRGCVALQRGPLIYCFESHDQPDNVDLQDVQVITSESLDVTAVPHLHGIRSIKVPGKMTSPWSDSLYKPLAELPQVESSPVQLTAIPYFAWGNRGMQSMRVWLPQATA